MEDVERGSVMIMMVNLRLEIPSSRVMSAANVHLRSIGARQ